jgi:hypothetical protein
MKTSGGVAQCFHAVHIMSYPMRRASWDWRTLMPCVCVSYYVCKNLCKTYNI